MKSSFCIDLQRFMLIPTKFPLSQSMFRIELDEEEKIKAFTRSSKGLYFAIKRAFF